MHEKKLHNGGKYNLHPADNMDNILTTYELIVIYVSREIFFFLRNVKLVARAELRIELYMLRSTKSQTPAKLKPPMEKSSYNKKKIGA